ncbi:MAG: tRNA (adenosine(37)-N6)-dimethylallyltransferase MiaA [Armatimonadota bacterium]
MSTSSDTGAVPIIAIVGPTGVGKTDTAMAVASRIDGEIVSADSMQIYRGMDIGTAKPSPDDRRRVRFHLIDVVEPGERYTVAQFQRDAEAAIADIVGRGKTPILCGGSGLYVRAVVDHYAFPPESPDLALREELCAEAEREGPARLHARLAELDPVAAAHIHPHNVKRVIRALEICLVEGQPVQQAQKVDAHPLMPYNAAFYGLTIARRRLYERIEKRFDEMLAAGLVAEVRGLLASGCRPGSQSLQALGYKHIVAYVRGRLTYAEAVRLAKRDTRRYARRQYTWFRRDRRIQWLDLDEVGGPEGAADLICEAHPPGAPSQALVEGHAHARNSRGCPTVRG